MRLFFFFLRLFIQGHNSLKLKLIQRGRVLAGMKGSGDVLQGESTHRPRKFACPAPSSRASLSPLRVAQDAARDTVNTWTKPTHDTVRLTRQPGPPASLFPAPNHRTTDTDLTWKNHKPLLPPEEKTGPE